jgi:hypothetical protein
MTLPRMRKLANDMLGLPEEELDDVVARMLNEGS